MKRVIIGFGWLVAACVAVAGTEELTSFSADSVVTTPIDGENQDGVVENTITSVKVMRGDVDVSDNWLMFGLSTNRTNRNEVNFNH